MSATTRFWGYEVPHEHSTMVKYYKMMIDTYTYDHKGELELIGLAIGTGTKISIFTKLKKKKHRVPS